LITHNATDFCRAFAAPATDFLPILAQEKNHALTAAPFSLSPFSFLFHSLVQTALREFV
jgi:hypothetical protein